MKQDKTKYCKKCILPENYPGLKLDSEGVCNFCREGFSTRLEEFSDKEKITKIIKEKYKNRDSQFDAIVAISGGCDSSYALIKTVQDFNLKTLAVHVDHGFECSEMTASAKGLCKELGVELKVLKEESQFWKELWKHLADNKIEGVNFCFVCGYMIALSLVEFAVENEIPLIINGHSRGVLRKLDDLSKVEKLLKKRVQESIQQKGSKFLRLKFESKIKWLDKQGWVTKQKDLINGPLEKGMVQVLPFYLLNFYRYDKDFLAKECKQVFAEWQAPNKSYPKRTSNCKMNWLSVDTDLKNLGYTVYHEEYSQLIRNGEMTREQALEDLNFKLNDEKVKELIEKARKMIK
jgi:tRNA(Ile)-lysidine synthase TilS/MesJ